MTTPAPDAEELLARLASWPPEAQQMAASALESAMDLRWRPFYCGRLDCDGRAHGDWAWPHARGDQHPPRWPWDTWIELGGRGAGKTRNGAELTHRWATVRRPGRRMSDIRIALVAPTAADARDTLVEGESGLLATMSPTNPCGYEPTKRRVTWRSGARATLYSADVPDRIRGPQHHFAWVDEACYYANVQEVWDNLRFGLRLGQRPRAHITTTPKPRPWLRNLLRDQTVAVTRASTYANLDNLAPTFRSAVLDKYEGTRLGRQEIHAEVLEDIEGALWTAGMIDADRLGRPALNLDAIVIGLDPPGSTTEAEAGIVVVGRAGDQCYVLQDLSDRMSPVEWGTAALAALERWQAHAIVAEKNYGGDMVLSTLRMLPGGLTAPIIGVHARQGKALRAEPVVALYEQHRVHHIGVLPVLENQMTEWVPGDAESPDRLDALVHAVTHLMVKAPPSQLSNPAALDRRIDGRSPGRGLRMGL